jgi:hypothetical protein
VPSWLKPTFEFIDINELYPIVDVALELAGATSSGAISWLTER